MSRLRFIRRLDVTNLTCDSSTSTDFFLHIWPYQNIYSTCQNSGVILYTLFNCYSVAFKRTRTDSRLAPSQWKTSLQSNAVSHWLGTNPESVLYDSNWQYCKVGSCIEASAGSGFNIKVQCQYRNAHCGDVTRPYSRLNPTISLLVKQHFILNQGSDCSPHPGEHWVYLRILRKRKCHNCNKFTSLGASAEL